MERKSKLHRILAALACTSAVPVSAATFVDDKFQLSNYTSNVQQTGGATIDVSQTVTGGNPGSALQVLSTVPAGGSGFRFDAYSLNKSFTWNPNTQGAIQSIDYSEDVFINFVGLGLGSRAGDLLVFQNGNY